MKYSTIAKHIYKENLPLLAKYWWAFLGISGLYHLYQYLIFKFVTPDQTYFSKVMLAYHVLVYPMIALIIMYLVDCHNRRQLPKDFGKVVADAKRCYLRILLVYLAADIMSRYLGTGGGLIVFAILYIKLPFLEQEMFFKDSSLWTAIKHSNELTNREDMVRTITVLMLIFLPSYLIIKKLNQFTQSSGLEYKQMILLTISLIERTFYLFGKAVLTKVYTDKA
jgi:hypothetical protein